MLPRPMTAGDFTCLCCGSRLELKLEELKIGENRGVCPMCSEPFCLRINSDDMAGLIDAEEQLSRH